MDRPETLDAAAYSIVKLVSYGLGYGTSRSRIAAQVREYMEQYLQLISTVTVCPDGPDCADPQCEDQHPQSRNERGTS